MRKYNVLLFLLFTFSTAFTQKISIIESTATYNGVARSGMSTCIELDYKTVEKLWQKHLKSYGKYSENNGIGIVQSASVYDVSSKQVTVYSSIKSTTKGAEIWWAIDLGNGYASKNSNTDAYKKAEQLLHTFASDCYKDNISLQIKDAERALLTSDKNYEREVKRSEQLARNVEKNKLEKVKLEDQIKENAENLESLKKEILQNKEDQKNAVAEIEKMKRGVEVVKEKMALVQ